MKPNQKVKFVQNGKTLTGEYIEDYKEDGSRIVVVCAKDNRRYCIDKPTKSKRVAAPKDESSGA